MSITPHILIADDDPVVHESLGLYLDAENFTYASAYDGEEALNMVQTEKPDLIILDLMMPKMSGIDVCRNIRKTSNVPIIMLTAKGEEIDRVLGLELGADDYIVKPFSPREVIARIKVVFRRIHDAEQGSHNQSILRFDGLEINLDNYQVKVDDEAVAFTPKEVEILY
ncbi:MAG: response regulator transcription factor, partial [Saccharofermentanales bacterium]